MEVKFELKEICLNLAQRRGNDDVPILKIVVDTLGAQVKVRTFDLVVGAYLGGIYVQHLEFRGTSFYNCFIVQLPPASYPLSIVLLKYDLLIISHTSIRHILSL